MVQEGLTGWPAAVAVFVGSVLLGFRIYLSAKKEVRTDSGQVVLNEGYQHLIKDLRDEVARLTVKVQACDDAHDENRKLKIRVSELEQEVATLRALVQTQLSPGNRRVDP